MALTLAQQVTNVQAQLLDDGTDFSTAHITAALRQALHYYNQRSPINGAEIVSVISGQLQYELTAGAYPTLVLDIIDVLKNDDSGESDDPLEYDKIFEDNRNWIRLRDSESSGNLLIRFTQPHTINGLDSEIETTLNTDQDEIITNGTCAYALEIRLLSRIESINLKQAARIEQSYINAINRFFVYFNLGILRYSTRSIPVAETRTTSWLDKTGVISANTSSIAGTLRDL